MSKYSTEIKPDFHNAVDLATIQVLEDTVEFLNKTVELCLARIKDLEIQERALREAYEDSTNQMKGFRAGQASQGTGPR